MCPGRENLVKLAVKDYVLAQLEKLLDCLTPEDIKITIVQLLTECSSLQLEVSNREEVVGYLDATFNIYQPRVMESILTLHGQVVSAVDRLL